MHSRYLGTGENEMNKQQIVELIYKTGFVYKKLVTKEIREVGHAPEEVEKLAEEILRLAAAQWQPGVLEEEKLYGDEWKNPPPEEDKTHWSGGIGSKALEEEGKPKCQHKHLSSWGELYTCIDCGQKRVGEDAWQRTGDETV